jgi:hypothetical protein
MENENKELEKFVSGLVSMLKKASEQYAATKETNKIVPDKRITCAYCSDTFSSSGRYNQHKRDYHRMLKGIKEKCPARNSKWWDSLTPEQRQERIRRLNESHLKYLESRKTLR